jgi:hypothetical protein
MHEGSNLSAGFDIGINTSAGLTNWLTPSPAEGDLKMVCPGGQTWCAMFITAGASLTTFPRPGLDLSMYQTMMVEVRGDPGTTIDVGIKDTTQPDDGTEAKVSLPVGSNWVTYAIPLSRFVGANLKKIYMPCEFVFAGGTRPQTLHVNSITYSTTAAPSLPSGQSGASFMAGADVKTRVRESGRTLSKPPRFTIALHELRVSMDGQTKAASRDSAERISALAFPSLPMGTPDVSSSAPLGAKFLLTWTSKGPKDLLTKTTTRVPKGSRAIGSKGVPGAASPVGPILPSEIILMFDRSTDPASQTAQRVNNTGWYSLDAGEPSAGQAQIFFEFVPDNGSEHKYFTLRGSKNGGRKAAWIHFKAPGSLIIRATGAEPAVRPMDYAEFITRSRDITFSKAVLTVFLLEEVLPLAAWILIVWKVRTFAYARISELPRTVRKQARCEVDFMLHFAKWAGVGCYLSWTVKDILAGIGIAFVS